MSEVISELFDRKLQIAALQAEVTRLTDELLEYKNSWHARMREEVERAHECSKVKRVVMRHDNYHEALSIIEACDGTVVVAALRPSEEKK